MRRGNFTNGDNTRKVAALVAQLEQAIKNGEDVKAAALQIQIDELRAETADAKATGQNAQQMVRNREPRLTTLEGVASTVQTALANGDAEHARLDQRIDNIQLTPGPQGEPGPTGPKGDTGDAGPAGRDGNNGAAGINGRNGIDGQPGAAGLKGDKGDAGPQGTKGDSGPTGPTGIAGTRGDIGPQGPKGDTGPAGPTNLQIEYRDGIAVPAMLSLLGSAATVDIAITWPTPFPDTNYLPTVQATPLDATLIGRTNAVVKTKTATGITVTVTTTAVLAAGKCVLSAVAYRKN